MMKLVLVPVALAAMFLTGCAFDASSRPIQPTPAAAISPASQAYCCASCDVEDEQAVCTDCRRTEAESCSGDSSRLLCVSNRVEEPETATTARVTCY